MMKPGWWGIPKLFWWIAIPAWICYVALAVFEIAAY